jgi:hypothetical protein
MKPIMNTLDPRSAQLDWPLGRLKKRVGAPEKRTVARSSRGLAPGTVEKTDERGLFDLDALR